MSTLMSTRLAVSKYAEATGTFVLLDILKRGFIKSAYYRSIAEAALSALNPTSFDHADELMREAVCLLLRKNHDYGASVFDVGPLTKRLPPETAALVRLGDKYNRLVTLMDTDPKVATESRRDTVFDVLGYAIILTGMAVEKEKKIARYEQVEEL